MKETFSRTIYPKRDFLEQIAQDSNESLERIETWFRAERLKQLELGKIKYEVINNLKEND